MSASSTLLRLFATGFTLCISVNARADNWDRFRGPNGTGIVKDTNVPVKFSASDNVRWKVKIPGDGNGSPIIWGERVFLQTAALDGSERSLLCLDAKTGKEIWTSRIPGIIPKQSLRKDSSLASATPTTDGEAVFVPYWDGKDIIMVAYRCENGAKLWERNLGEFVSQHGPGASPFVYKDLLIFSLDMDAFRVTVHKDKLEPKTKKSTETKTPVAKPSTLFAFDKRTGKTVWEAPRDAVRACYSMPFILERPGAAPELLVTSTSAITSYEPLTGKANWYWTWTFAKDPLRTIGSSVFADGTLLACSGDGSGERLMVAVDLKGQAKEVRPEQLWANKKQFPYTPCVLTKDGHVYFVNDFGIAGCFELKTGKEVWFERLPDAKTIYASPLMIDGKVYALSEPGDVYVFAADTKFNLIARNSMGERIRATPAVANGCLYVRTQHHLFCIASDK